MIIVGLVVISIVTIVLYKKLKEVYQEDEPISVSKNNERAKPENPCHCAENEIEKEIFQFLAEHGAGALRAKQVSEDKFLLGGWRIPATIMRGEDGKISHVVTEDKIWPPMTETELRQMRGEPEPEKKTKKKKEIPEAFVRKNFECILDSKILELQELMDEAAATDGMVHVDTVEMFGKAYSAKHRHILCELMENRVGFLYAELDGDGIAVCM